MMLLAARALTFMADVLPQSCGAIVRHGAVVSFCQRLLTIEYIDLAEQSLQALEKLSHEHSPALLQQGGLLAVRLGFAVMPRLTSSRHSFSVT